MIFKRVLSQEAENTYLKRVAKLNKQKITAIKKEYVSYLQNITLDTHFNIVFKHALPEPSIRVHLLKISELNDIDLPELTDKYSEYLRALPFERHFEVILKKISSEVVKEQYFQKLVSLTGVNLRAIKTDYKAFVSMQDASKKQDDYKKFPLLLEKTFNLGYLPYVSYQYSESHNILSFNTENETLNLCNIFAPVSKITSEINGKKKTHLKLLMRYMNKNVEIIESTRDLIKTDRLANTFGDYGFIIDNARATKMAKFIADYTLDNQYKINHEIGCLQTGWRDGVFYIPQRTQDVVWLEPNLKRAYTQSGTLENQKALMLELSKGKVFINVLGTFASSLYGLLDNRMNFFIHNGGITESGKSLAVKCALSFFGQPTAMGNNWNTTLNGLETYWEQNHSLPTWIDEMEVSSKLENIIEAVYVFSDGHGKLRAFAKDEEVRQRETKTFKGICFTTGEKSFVEIQNMANNRSKPRGVTGRVLDLNIKDLWTNVDMEIVKELLDNNHGILGIDYINYLEKNAAGIKADFSNQVSFFSGIVSGRKADQFGLLKLALEIIHRMKLINTYEYDMQVANLKHFATLEAEKLIIIKDTFTEFKEAYTEFIVSNSEHFDFMTDMGYLTEHTKTPFYGKVDLGQNVISIFPKLFQSWCIEHNFVKDQVIETLEDNKKLEFNPKRGSSKDKQVRFRNKPMWCYQFTGLFDTHQDIPVVFETVLTYKEPQAQAVERNLLNTDSDEIPF